MSLGGHVHHVTPTGRLIAHHGDYPPHWDDPEDLEETLDRFDAPATWDPDITDDFDAQQLDDFLNGAYDDDQAVSA